MAAPRELIIDVVGQSISGQGSGNRVIPPVPYTLTQSTQYEMNHITLPRDKINCLVRCTRVALMYQPSCLLPCCQGKLGELTKKQLSKSQKQFVLSLGI